MIKFEWDEPKAVANLKKHQVSFDEAKSIFEAVAYSLKDDLDAAKCAHSMPISRLRTGTQRAWLLRQSPVESAP